MSDPDVIVCGAGPAGAVTALLLGRAGVRVLLLDRARFPRPKLCGDTLNPGALAVLDRLGLGHVTAGGLPIDGMIVTGDAACRVDGRYEGGITGCALPRSVLDTALVRAAAAQVRFEEGVLVRRPLTDAGRVRGVVVAGRSGADLPIRAGLVVAADGGRSRLARALGLAWHPRSPRRWAVGGCFEGVAGLSTSGEMHVRRDGYIGVAPLPGGIANACVVSGDRAALARPGRLLAATLGADPLLAGRFARARQIGRIEVLGPLAVETSASGCDGLLLAGDAAGFIDPMTGDGLRFALRGAELAADAALAALIDGSPSPHRQLARARRDAFGHKWRFDRLLRALVGSPLAVRAAARGAVWMPGWVRHSIRYAGDVHAA